MVTPHFKNVLFYSKVPGYYNVKIFLSRATHPKRSKKKSEGGAGWDGMVGEKIREGGKDTMKLTSGTDEKTEKNRDWISTTPGKQTRGNKEVKQTW